MSRVISLIEVYGKKINQRKNIFCRKSYYKDDKRIGKLGQISRQWAALVLK